MLLSVIENPDARRRDKYEIARVIYAETSGRSLRGAEALASMISNAATRRGCDIVDVVRDSDMFECRIQSSPRNALMDVAVDNAGFQMCLRVVQKMQKGNLADACCGATRFHHDGVIPDWAIARGYIAEIDGLLFYL